MQSFEAEMHTFGSILLRFEKIMMSRCSHLKYRSNHTWLKLFSTNSGKLRTEIEQMEVYNVGLAPLPVLVIKDLNDVLGINYQTNPVAKYITKFINARIKDSHTLLGTLRLNGNSPNHCGISV